MLAQVVLTIGGLFPTLGSPLQYIQASPSLPIRSRYVAK